MFITGHDPWNLDGFSSSAVVKFRLKRERKVVCEYIDCMCRRMGYTQNDSRGSDNDSLARASVDLFT